MLIESDTERCIDFRFHFRHDGIDFNVIKHEVTTVRTHAVIVDLQPITLIFLVGREHEEELLPNHMVSTVPSTVNTCITNNTFCICLCCSWLLITIIQLIDLAWAETVDGIAIAKNVLTLNSNCNTAWAAEFTIIIISVGTRNPTRTHQLVRSTEFSLKVNGTDVTRLLRGINIHKGFLHTWVCIDVISVFLIVGRQDNLIITPNRSLLCHKCV